MLWESKLRSSCLCGRNVSNWAIFPALCTELDSLYPREGFCLGIVHWAKESRFPHYPCLEEKFCQWIHSQEMRDAGVLPILGRDNEESACLCPYFTSAGITGNLCVSRFSPYALGIWTQVPCAVSCERRTVGVLAALAELGLQTELSWRLTRRVYYISNNRNSEFSECFYWDHTFF